MPVKRLVCVVEGKGEVEALPNLCARIRDYLGAWNWIVDENPVKQPRGKLVDESVPSPHRPAARQGVENAVQLALTRPADGVLVLCDEDDDCAAIWGPSARGIIQRFARGDAVMVVREYETWILHSASDEARAAAGIRDSDISRRDAKKFARLLIPRYKPATHQLVATRGLQIDRVWARSDSFDKLMQCLGTMFGVNMPARPH